MKKGINISFAILQILIAIGLFVGVYFLIGGLNSFVGTIPQKLSETCDACIASGENTINLDVVSLLPANFSWAYLIPAVLLIIGIYFLIISIKQNA